MLQFQAYENDFSLTVKYNHLQCESQSLNTENVSSMFLQHSMRRFS